jgi:DNA transformation protein and related proteins
MEKLSDLPNIGTVLEEKLIQVGIPHPAALTELGSCDAFIRLYTIDPAVCINTLYALEGAVEGIRWHQLGKETKAALLQFYHRLTLE